MIYALIELKQALSAVDLVMRELARQLELDETGVMVLALLARDGHCGASDLAYLCGRARQQVHRSLLGLEQVGLVEPTHLSPERRVLSWGLTEPGLERWRLLEHGLRAWEPLLSDPLQVPELQFALRKITQIIVNRPSSDGWKQGLLVPTELRKVPLRTRALMEADAKGDQAVPETDVPREPRRGRATCRDEDLTDEDLAEQWRAMWR